MPSVYLLSGAALYHTGATWTRKLWLTTTASSTRSMSEFSYPHCTYHLSIFLNPLMAFASKEALDSFPEGVWIKIIVPNWNVILNSMTPCGLHLSLICEGHQNVREFPFKERSTRRERATAALTFRVATSLELPFPLCYPWSDTGRWMSAHQVFKHTR